MNAAASSLAALVAAAPVITALDADFKRNRWTFTLPPQPVGPGDYVVLRATDARDVAASAAAQPGALTLQAPQAMQAHVFYPGGGTAVRFHDDTVGYALTAYRDHTPHRDDPRWHPAHWWGSESRTDSAGDDWQRSLPRMVMDDFGFLAEVAA